LTLGNKVLTNPDIGRVLIEEELPRAKVAVAVLQGLTEAANDSKVPKGDAVIVLNGFTLGVGLPGDLEPGYKASDLLTKACEASGLRPGVWRLSDKTTIFSAIVDEEGH
jgi:AMMECR1 domain-containing protein